MFVNGVVSAENRRGKSGITKFGLAVRTTPEFQLILLFKNHPRVKKDLSKFHLRTKTEQIFYESVLDLR